MATEPDPYECIDLAGAFPGWMITLGRKPLQWFNDHIVENVSNVSDLSELSFKGAP